MANLQCLRSNAFLINIVTKVSEGIMKLALKPEKIFLLFAIFLGLLLVFLMPPLMGADEQYHLSRIYSLSEGKVASSINQGMTGNFVPTAVHSFVEFWYPMIKDTHIKTDCAQIVRSSKIFTDKDNLQFSNQKYQTLYHPLAYLPQTMGMIFAKFFTKSVYWLLISSKLFLLAFYIAVGYCAIKITPVFKWLFLTFLLIPTAMSLGASVSADGVLIPIAFLYFAYIFKYTFEENLYVDKKAVFIFSLLVIMLALVKQSFLISLFLFFIPKKKFGRFYFYKILAIIFPGALCAFLWSIVCQRWFIPLNQSSPVLQAHFILQHPFIYLITLLKTIKFCFVMWLYMVIGVLGWNNVFLFPVTYILYFCMIIMNSVYDDSSIDKAVVTCWQKLLLFVIFIINFVFIATELYLSWTPPYFTEFISFIQGRYLIPILLPVFVLIGLLFTSCRKRTAIFNYVSYIFLFITYLNVFVSIFILYYLKF